MKPWFTAFNPENLVSVSNNISEKYRDASQAGMNTILQKLILPTISLLLAGMASYALQFAVELADGELLILAVSLFAAILSSLHYFLNARSTRLLNLKIDNVLGLESSLLKKISQIEKSQPDGNTHELMERIDNLEAKLADMLHGEVSNVAVERNVGIDHQVALSAYDDEKVVRLKTNRSLVERMGKGGARKTKPAGPEIIRLFENGVLTVKAKPVFNLATREIEAIEAHGYLETGEQTVAVESLLKSLSDEQRCQHDIAMITKLSQIARQLENDLQSLPIHYTFVSARTADQTEWSRITNFLRSDNRLSAFLVPGVTMADYQKMDSPIRTRFLELKELGFELALDACEGLKAITKIVQQKRFSTFRIPADQLLGYATIEGQRAAELLLDQIGLADKDSGKNTAIIATGIAAEHEALNLMDLNILSGQGDFLSPARTIRLQAKVHGNAEIGTGNEF